jgi:hypothetical protein
VSTYGIYRLPGPQALARWRMYHSHGEPRPKRVAVLEAPSQLRALEAFARAEEARSRQVTGWHTKGRRTSPRLYVTLTNGAQAHHQTAYVAWKTEAERSTK